MSVTEGLVFVLVCFVVAPITIAALLSVGDRIRRWLMPTDGDE